LVKTLKLNFLTDAEFVDVIHSSRLGMNEKMGHADFYPNGGRFQFDCFDNNYNDIVSGEDSFRRLARVLTGMQLMINVLAHHKDVQQFFY